MVSQFFGYFSLLTSEISCGEGNEFQTVVNPQQSRLQFIRDRFVNVESLGGTKRDKKQ